MDTKTFLLEREEISRRLNMKRHEVLAGHSGLPGGFLGLSWGDISQLVFSLGGGRGFSAWLPRVLFTAAAPFFASLFRDKMNQLVNGKSFARRVVDLLSNLRTRL